MVSQVSAPPPGLAQLFTDTSRLPDLLCLPPSEWGEFLHAVGARLDHVVDADLPTRDPVYEQMAFDLDQFIQRIGLYADDLTPDGQALARIGETPLVSRTEAQSTLLQETLATRIREHYRGDEGRPVVATLQNAAHLVSRVPGGWAGYCPGLLLGEVRHLLMQLARCRRPRPSRNSNASHTTTTNGRSCTGPSTTLRATTSCASASSTRPSICSTCSCRVRTAGSYSATSRPSSTARRGSTTLTHRRTKRTTVPQPGATAGRRSSSRTRGSRDRISN